MTSSPSMPETGQQSTLRAESPQAWTVVTLTPGKHPLTALANALAPYLGQDEERLLTRVREEWSEVARELRRRRRSAGPLLLFMDQLEELRAKVVRCFEAGALATGATLELAEPIQLASTPAQGEEIRGQGKGRLTVPGITRQVDLDLRGRWNGSTIQVVGQLPVRMSDYQIEAPRFGPVVSIEDSLAVDFNLVFERA